MSAKRDAPELTDPFTVPGAINRRLSWARDQESLSLEKWMKRLVKGGYSVSRSSVAEYEWYRRREKNNDPRMPPSDYLGRVHEEFGYRLDWLIHGSGEPKEIPDSETDQRIFEGHLYNELVSWLQHVAWSSSSVNLRLSMLRLLAEVDRAIPEGPERDESTKAAFESTVRYLNTVVPTDDAWFADLSEMSSRECQQVWMHIEGILYHLFRPFREEAVAYLWSRTLSRKEDETHA